MNALLNGYGEKTRLHSLEIYLSDEPPLDKGEHPIPAAIAQELWNGTSEDPFPKGCFWTVEPSR